MQSIRGKQILLIGATGGIGSETAALLAGSGARLFLVGRDPDKLQALCTRLSVPVECSMAVDLTDAEQVGRIRDRYFSVYPQLDVLINASGIGILKPVEQLSDDDFMKTLQVNLFAPFSVIRSFLPHLKEQKKGLLIHVPGVLGKVPMAGAAAYCASKYGLTGMMQCVREELKRTEVRITNLFLGGVDSPFWDTIDLRVQRDKMITAEEAAKAIWFLCQQPDSGVIGEMVLQPFNHQAI